MPKGRSQSQENSSSQRPPGPEVQSTPHRSLHDRSSGSDWRDTDRRTGPTTDDRPPSDSRNSRSYPSRQGEDNPSLSREAATARRVSDGPGNSQLSQSQSQTQRDGTQEKSFERPPSQQSIVKLPSSDSQQILSSSQTTTLPPGPRADQPSRSMDPPLRAEPNQISQSRSLPALKPSSTIPASTQTQASALPKPVPTGPQASRNIHRQATEPAPRQQPSSSISTSLPSGPRADRERGASWGQNTPLQQTQTQGNSSSVSRAPTLPIIPTKKKSESLTPEIDAEVRNRFAPH